MRYEHWQTAFLHNKEGLSGQNDIKVSKSVETELSGSDNDKGLCNSTIV